MSLKSSLYNNIVFDNAKRQDDEKLYVFNSEIFKIESLEERSRTALKFSFNNLSNVGKKIIEHPETVIFKSRRDLDEIQSNFIYVLFDDISNINNTEQLFSDKLCTRINKTLLEEYEV